MTACKQELRAQHVGNALYGLKTLVDSPELRGLVAALALKVQQCREPLTAQHVGNALSARGQKELQRSTEAVLPKF